MSVISFAVVGKNNEPLYLKEFFDNYDEINHRSINNCSEEELFGLKYSSTSSGIGGSSTDNITTNDSSQMTTSTTSKKCSLRQQFILHASIDRFEQLSGPPPGCAWRIPGVTGTDAMFVGLLYTIEEFRIYGYMTTTQIRFLLVIEDDYYTFHNNNNKDIDNKIKNLFMKLHRVYVEYILNPFHQLTSTSTPINSIRFDTKIDECMKEYHDT